MVDERSTRPTLDDFLDLIRRCTAPGRSWTTGSPFEIETDDGAVVYLLVVKSPWDEQRRWRVEARSL